MTEPLTLTDAQAAEMAARVHTSQNGREQRWADMAITHLRNAARRYENPEMAAYADWREAREQAEEDA